MSTLRLVRTGWLFHLKSLALSGFFLLTTVWLPVLIATISYYMFKAGARPGTLFYASLGAGVYGIWSATLFGSGGAIQWQRWQGTLEVLVAAPAPFFLVLLPLTVATATIGLYSLAMTLFWGRFLFGIPLHVAHPLAFAVSIPATVIALGLLGLVLASTFILYRWANALSNLLEYPVWLVTGLLVPVSLLPGWVTPLSWLLAPTWGVRAIREASIGGDPWSAIGMTVVLSAAYLVLGSFFLRLFLRLARERAALSLT
jgi:ABC-2 type transport system permease protein